MKTFRLVGMALLAVLLCANFASCSKDDSPEEDPNKGNSGGGVVTVNEKKLVKMVSNNETRTFSYDDKGRLSAATKKYKNSPAMNYQFIWGDEAIMVKEKYDDEKEWSSYNLTLKNGLVQSSNNSRYGDATVSYNSSNRFINAEIVSAKRSYNAIWDGDKLVSSKTTVSSMPYLDVILTYGETCKKGYCPIIPWYIDFDCVILFMANPEIAGMRTNQLPTKATYDDGDYENITYEFDKEGYISKVTFKYDDGDSDVYTLTWK